MTQPETVANDLYFRFDDENKIKYTYASQSSQEKWESSKRTAPYIA